MLQYELEGNYTTAQLFRDAPELQYLPIAASERGMYGTFVQGSTQLFFVFGYDKGLIFNGNFIEIDGSLYVASDYYKERRVHIHSQTVLRRSYNAYPFSHFHHSAAETSCVMELMNNLERAVAIAHKFNLPFWEYFNYSPTFAAMIDQYYAAIAAARSGQEKKRLEEEMSWKFRSFLMTSENPRPEDKGLTLEDYRNSAYCVDRNPAAVEKMFHQPEKWESHLFGFTKDYADNSALSAIFVQDWFAGNLEELLHLHRIPYRFADPDSISPKLMRHLTEANVIVQREICRKRLVLVYPAIYSVFIHYLIRWALIDCAFTKEEKEAGYRLYQTGQFYGFSIALSPQLLQMLRSRGVVLYAHELVQLRVLSGYLDVYCFAHLCQKPLIDATLLEFAAQQAHIHSQGVSDFYAAAEMRIPEWWGDTHHIAVCRQGYQTGCYVGGKIAETDYYETAAEHFPDQDLKDNGHLTDTPITSQDIYMDDPKPPIEGAGFHWDKI